MKSQQLNNKTIQKKRMQGFDVDYPIMNEIKEIFYKNSLSSEIKDGGKIIGELILSLNDFLTLDSNKSLRMFILNSVNDSLIMNERKIIFDHLNLKGELIKENNGNSGFTGNSTNHSLLYLPHLEANKDYYIKNKIPFFSRITFIENGIMDLDDKSNNNSILYINLEIMI